MNDYIIHVAKTAKEDQQQAIRWYAENYSEDHAKRWNDGLELAISSLAENPERCAFVHENPRLSADVRRLLYGKSKRTKHRIIFMIEENTVHILRVRHSAQQDIGEVDLPSML